MASLSTISDRLNHLQASRQASMRARGQASKQEGKQARGQASKQERGQASKQEGKQASKRASRQAGRKAVRSALTFLCHQTALNFSLKSPALRPLQCSIHSSIGVHSSCDSITPAFKAHQALEDCERSPHTACAGFHMWLLHCQVDLNSPSTHNALNSYDRLPRRAYYLVTSAHSLGFASEFTSTLALALTRFAGIVGLEAPNLIDSTRSLRLRLLFLVPADPHLKMRSHRWRNQEISLSRGASAGLTLTHFDSP